jgi:hypothetical protein
VGPRVCYRKLSGISAPESSTMLLTKTSAEDSRNSFRASELETDSTMRRHNAWLPSWFSKEQTLAWEDMPLAGGKIAPFTEQFRAEWREWYKKYHRQFPHPELEHAYAEIDRQKAKENSCAR